VVTTFEQNDDRLRASLQLLSEGSFERYSPRMHAESDRAREVFLRGEKTLPVSSLTEPLRARGRHPGFFTPHERLSTSKRRGGC
jgi:hypothetical protein